MKKCFSDPWFDFKYRGDSSRPGGRWDYVVFVTIRDGQLGGGWYLIKVWDVKEKKFNAIFLYN